jgi:hypothetical protein
LSCCIGKLPGIEAFKNQGFTERGEITLSWYSHDKSKNYLFDAAVDGKDKDNERIPLQVNHASPANGKQWCQALLDLSPGKHQVNIRSRCENGSQFFCGEQSATITIVVPPKPTPVVIESHKKAPPAAPQAPSSLTASIPSLGVASASPFGVSSSFGLPFHFLPTSDSLAATDLSDSVLPVKSAFVPAPAAVSASFPSAPTLPQAVIAQPWSSYSGSQTSVWGDHSTSLKPIQSNLSWTASSDDKTDAINSDDAAAKAALPSFFAADSVVDFVLEDDDDMSETLDSSLFGFDESLGANSDSWSSSAVAVPSSSSFATSSASPWAPTASLASLPTSASVPVSAAANVPPPSQAPVSPVSPVSPIKAPSQAAASTGIPVQALIALATDATSWSPSDFNDGIRFIFQRLNMVEAATCAGSLRSAFAWHLRSPIYFSPHLLTGMNS